MLLIIGIIFKKESMMIISNYIKAPKSINVNMFLLKEYFLILGGNPRKLLFFFTLI